MKLRKTRRHPVESIDIRRPQNRIAQATQVSHSLIIGHHHDDIRPRSLEGFRLKAKATEKRRDESKSKQRDFHKQKRCTGFQPVNLIR